MRLLPCTLLFALFGLFLVLEGRVLALEKPGENLKEVGLTTVNGSLIDLNLSFTDSAGRTATLGEFFLPGKPNIIVPAYYDCPRLCGLLLDGVKELLPKIGLELGIDYRVITISFNPKDDSADAERIRSRYFKALSLDENKHGDSWKFLTGAQENIVLLMKSLGFHYMEDGQDFAHTAAVFLITDRGMISQHFAGISFPFRDVRLALIEASEGKIGTLLDHALLFCFRFDPSQGKYTWAAFNIMRAGGGITFLFLVGLIFWLRRSEKKNASVKENG